MLNTIYINKYVVNGYPMKALIIIDMWDRYHPGHTRFQNILEQTVNRLSNVIKRWQGPVVLACYNTHKDLVTNQWQTTNLPWTSPNLLLEITTNDHSNSIIDWDKDSVFEFLVKHNTTELVYAGASLPGCILDRPLGIKSMQQHFNCSVLIDCAINLTSTGYNEQEIIHDAYRFALNNNYNLYTSNNI